MPKIGDLIYLPFVDVKAPAAERFWVAAGEIVDVAPEGYLVRYVWHDETIVGLFPPDNFHETREGAEHKVLAAEEWAWRGHLDEVLDGQHPYLSAPIARLDGVYHTGNPLRWGEPHLGYGAQISTWSKAPNVAKVLQIMGSIVEDIHMLYGILRALAHANDHAKKLVAKYIVIELHSLYRCCERLAKLDPANEADDFAALKQEVAELDETYGFRALRDKIAGHRDMDLDFADTIGFWRKLTRYALKQYTEAFDRYFERVLPRHPRERDYFAGCRPVHGVTGLEENTGWVPFDEPFEANK